MDGLPILIRWLKEKLLLPGDVQPNFEGGDGQLSACHCRNQLVFEGENMLTNNDGSFYRVRYHVAVYLSMLVRRVQRCHTA